MKRKRKSREPGDAKRRRLLESHDADSPTAALLRVYYPAVLTLRKYLASQLAKGHKQRGKKILRFGLQTGVQDEATAAIIELLDATIVGCPDGRAASSVEWENLDQDLTVYTQHLTASTASISPTQGAFKQSEILDFVIWSIFNRQTSARRPAHLLSHGFHRNANGNGDPTLQPLPGVPGVLTGCRNEHVCRLKSSPWTSLPSLIGPGAERLISRMLLDCGVFLPIGEGSNLMQISGIPLSDLTAQKQASWQLPIAHPRPSRAQTGPVERQCKQRSLADIRFVRYRMLYAKPTLSGNGNPRVGLNDIHILQRLRDVDNDAETLHVAKYIFPRQFGLHNVFTSSVDRAETAQPFKDYSLRDKEIAHAADRQRRKQRAAIDEHKQSWKHHVPKRLRGEAMRLIQSVRRRHARCPYHALLEHHCPRVSSKQSTDQGSLVQATSFSAVSAYCRAIVRKVFPQALWGHGEAGRANFRSLMHLTARFVCLRRYETFSLHDVVQGFNLSCIQWLAPPKIDPIAKLGRSDFDKRRELLAEIIYYLFDSFLIPLIRGTFHVTESSINRNQLFYFRHDVWRYMTESALGLLRANNLEPCGTAEVRQHLARRSLGISQIRLVPKEAGMRPIINLRRRVQRLQHGQPVLGKSINSLLTPTFSVLNAEKEARPVMLGSALFSVDDLFPRLQRFRAHLEKTGRAGRPLYFAKVDVQACFDTIPQARVMRIASQIVQPQGYQISRYSRGKLVGWEDETAPAFGCKPSWKFVTKATPYDQQYSFVEHAVRDVADGRKRTVYIDGATQKPESRKAILEILKEHVENNLIRIGRHFYRQKQGIPQGSIISSLLCSYVYAELERDVLGFLKDGNTLLLRLIDDFLVISPDRSVAERFMQVMHAGVPEFGVQVKVEKSRANFDVIVSGQQIMPLPRTVDFPYCGYSINTATLDVTKDHVRRRRANLADSVTVELSNVPGQTFYRKTLNALKLQMHAMLLSTNYNSLQTVLGNIYHSFIEVAQKCSCYMRSLQGSKRPRCRLLIRTLEDTIKLACLLMRRRKRTGTDTMLYKCSVSVSQARWLGCTAFHTVFHKRQTKHQDLLVWLQAQLRKPETRRHQGLLESVALAYRS